jgi:predicted GNAT family acetyltransferase
VDIRVTQNDQADRFEVYADHRLAGFAEYERDGDTWTFTHTETDPELQGQGLATTLIGEALDEVRRQRGQVVPQCSFVRSFIKERPEYHHIEHRH